MKNNVKEETITIGTLKNKLMIYLNEKIDNNIHLTDNDIELLKILFNQKKN